MMKKEYLIPELAVSKFNAENIITQSPAVPTTQAVATMAGENMKNVSKNNIHVASWTDMQEVSSLMR